MIRFSELVNFAATGQVSNVYRKAHGPLDSANLSISSPQPDTSLHCETTDMGLASRAVSVPFPALRPVQNDTAQ